MELELKWLIYESVRLRCQRKGKGKGKVRGLTKEKEGDVVDGKGR